MNKFLLPLACMTLFVAALPVMADAGAGKVIFQQQGCGECHYVEGPAREKTIEDQLAKKGPELWYAGSKFNRPWLTAWLSRPEPIRPLKYNSLTEENPGNHPALSAEDSLLMADFLMSLTSDAVEKGVIKPRAHPKGRLIFTKRMPCNGCHRYVQRNKVMGGRTGPSLVGASERLNPDWIYAYLKNPKVFKPVRMMPVFDGILSPRDMEFVSSYVATF